MQINHLTFVPKKQKRLAKMFFWVSSPSKSAILALFVLLCPHFVLSQTAPPTPPSRAEMEADSLKMQWFKDAKLGVFVHWGLYAVNGVDESWSFYNRYLTHERYMEQRKGFTASKYNPTEWAQLFKDMGAKYAVLTTKHHDGMALWDTHFGDMSVVKQTPARRDLVTPFAQAIRNQGLKFGAYFSLIDWTHNDYPAFIKGQNRYEAKNDLPRWQRFLTYYEGQLKELSDTFNPDLFWFDGDWEHSADEWEASKMRQMLLARNPKVILNSRLAGHGDYDTPEQGIPISKPKSKYWELCLTSNDSWGYQGTDLNYKTPFEIIRIFADVISMGGNLLLDFGPKEDGTFREEDLNIMREMGKWTKKHEEAIYGTRAGLPPGHFYGPSTVSADKKRLYLFLTGKPFNNQIVLKGIQSKIGFVRILGTGQKLYGHRMKGKPWWSSIPGITTIDLPEQVMYDPYMTVICIEFSEPIVLHREDGLQVGG